MKVFLAILIFSLLPSSALCEKVYSLKSYIESHPQMCTQDEDCIFMKVSCYSSCGDLISRKNQEKYKGMLKELCADYKHKEATFDVECPIYEAWCENAMCKSNGPVIIHNKLL